MDMFEKALDQIAERILGLDEDSITRLLPGYKKIMEDFQPNREWEKATIIFFIINAVRVKNTLFNDNVLKDNTKEDKKEKINPLKLIKS